MRQTRPRPTAAPVRPDPRAPLAVRGRRVRLGLLAIATATAASMVAASALAGPIFPAGAQLSALFEGGSFTEGVAAGHDGNIYFLDVTPTARSAGLLGLIMKFDPRSGATTVFRSPSGGASGMKFDSEGRMVLALGADYGARALIRTDLATGKSELLAGLYQGKPFNSLNDVAIAPDGSMYVTDPRYLGHEALEQPVYGVYRIDADKSVSLVVADVQKPNGVALSPDGKTLYVSEHNIVGNDLASMPGAVLLKYGPMRVLAFALDSQRRAGPARVLIDYGDKDGPDGLLTDAAGNLYVAERRDPNFGIGVFGADGTRLDFIRTPGKPTNLGFGRGPAAGKLYITAGTGLYSIDTTQRGWHSAALPRSHDPKGTP